MHLIFASLCIFLACLQRARGQHNSAKALECLEGYKLSGKTIVERHFSSPSLIICNLQCLRSETCIATNFQLLSGSGDGHCELLLPHLLAGGRHEVALESCHNAVYTRIKPAQNLEVNIWILFFHLRLILNQSTRKNPEIILHVNRENIDCIEKFKSKDVLTIYMIW